MTNKSLSTTASLFLGVSLAISLQYLLILPLFPWLICSLLLGIVIVSVVYYLEEEPTNDESSIFTKDNLVESLKITFILLLAMVPFSAQKVIMQAPAGSATTSLFEGSFQLPKWGFAIQLIAAGICMLISICIDKKTNFKKFSLGVIGAVAILAGIALWIIKW